MRVRGTTILIVLLAAVTLLPIAGSVAAGPPALVVNTTDDTDDGTCDTGHCSLREAINAANAHASPDTVTFNIPGSDPGCDGAGVCTVRPTNSLPVLTDDGTTIDAYTQSGARPNTNPFGQPINAVLKVVLDGSLLSQGFAVGLDIRSSGNLVRGLVIQRFRRGIDVSDANGNRFEGNFIGTDVHGTTALGNGCGGISIMGVVGGPGSWNNVVGGSAPQARNLISGNDCAGVSLGSGGGNRVQGNYVGSNVTGAVPLPNSGEGIRVASQDNQIGGTAQGEANLIVFNGGDGVLVLGGSGSARNTITRNRIHSNAGKGIALLSGGNAGLAPPVITSTSPTQVSGTACPNCVVEVFSDAEDEGAIYEGSTTADVSGNWTFTKPGGLAGPNVTATATDGAGNTSEFSAPVSLVQVTPTATATSTPTVTGSPSPTSTPTATPTGTLSPTATNTPSPTVTGSPPPTSTVPATPSPVFLPLLLRNGQSLPPVATASPTATRTGTASPTASNTPLPTVTGTASPTATGLSPPTSTTTATPTPSPGSTPTPTPSPGSTPTPSPGSTPTPMPGSAPTRTDTPIGVPT
ncbi:MAG: CSLREA domain-containing protein, partial [Anaerolineae bacterium]